MVREVRRRQAAGYLGADLRAEEEVVAGEAGQVERPPPHLRVTQVPATNAGAGGQVAAMGATRATMMTTTEAIVRTDRRSQGRAVKVTTE